MITNIKVSHFEKSTLLYDVPHQKTESPFPSFIKMSYNEETVFYHWPDICSFIW